MSRSGTKWDDHLKNISQLDLTGKPVAILGLGDSAAFSKYFCDAMDELYKAFEVAGGHMIGHVSVDDYIYDQSKSVADGKFCGLPIDEDNESGKTDTRLQCWARNLMLEIDKLKSQE